MAGRGVFRSSGRTRGDPFASRLDPVVGARVEPGLGRALGRLRDPLLLGVIPASFALLIVSSAYAPPWPIGFEFRGTLWEPARALLDGDSIYPEPMSRAVVVGNPAVYPPLFIVLAGDVPVQAWARSHADPALWYAAGTTLVVAIGLVIASAVPRPEGVVRQ